jgi:hypothetical protein
MTTKENVMKILDETKKVAEDNDEVTHVFVLLRVGNSYIRHSTQMDDTMSELGRIDLLKHDIINRMNQQSK